MRRKLTLRAEAICDLSADDLAEVGGGTGGPTLPAFQCVTNALRCAVYDPDSIICQVTRLPTCFQCC